MLNITKYHLYNCKFSIITNGDVINLLPKVALKISDYYVKLAKIKIKESAHIFMIHELGMLYKLNHPLNLKRD